MFQNGRSAGIWAGIILQQLANGFDEKNSNGQFVARCASAAENAAVRAQLKASAFRTLRPETAKNNRWPYWKLRHEPRLRDFYKRSRIYTS